MKFSFRPNTFVKSKSVLQMFDENQRWSLKII